MHNPSTHKYHTLDGVRGVAALFVLTRHAGPLFSPWVFAHSYLAVDLFFALSGFVLATAYDEKLRIGTLSVRTFMAIRLVRLWPLFALASLIGFLAWVAHWAAHGNSDWALARIVTTFALSLGMLPSPFGQTQDLPALFPLNSPSWSLFLEILANACYALFRSRLTSRMLVAIMAINALALACCSITFGGLTGGPLWADAFVGIPRVLYSFSAGVLLYRVRKARDLPRKENLNLVSVLFLVVVALFLGVRPPRGADACYDIFAGIAAVPIILLVGSSIEPGHRLSRLYAFLGLCSYGVYILQVPISGLVLKACHAMGIGVSSGAPLTGLTFAVLLILASKFLDRFFDQPIRSLMRRVLGLSA